MTKLVTFSQGFLRNKVGILAMLMSILNVFSTTPGFMKFGSNGSNSKSNITRTSLLFIVCDDMRPELSIYGKPWSHTPNFERLGNRSVTFDLAFAQVAVCNPSRDSMLTGLRPDTVAVHNFQASFRPHQPFFTHLKKAGFTTAGIGKVFNWDGDDSEIWSSYENFNTPNFDKPTSTIKVIDSQPETVFADYQATTAAINKLKLLSSKEKADKPFAIGLGLGSAHPIVPLPKKYIDLVKQHAQQNTPWPAHDKTELAYPKTAPIQNYHCCVASGLNLFNATPSSSRNKDTYVNIPKIPEPIQQEIYDEAMWSYLAGIRFIDAQLGRILDTIDELQLWDTLTVVVTSDHGMHVGEKGIWDKWTLFDESTQVPLVIHQPYSPFQGSHFSSPVELLDVFPTVLALAGVPYVKPALSSSIVPQGRSLEQIIMGKDGTAASGASIKQQQGFQGISPSITNLRKKVLHHKFNFALSQMLLCSNPAWDEMFDASGELRQGVNAEEDLTVHDRKHSALLWTFCNMDSKPKAALMGYSVRTREFRYTAYLPIDFATLAPDFSAGSVVLPWAEELYDHRPEQFWSPSATLQVLHNRERVSNTNTNAENFEMTGDDAVAAPGSPHSSTSGSSSSKNFQIPQGRYGKFELVNVVDDEHYSKVVSHYRTTLLNFLRTTMRYGKLPIKSHSKEFHDYQRQYKTSPSTSTAASLTAMSSSVMAGSLFRFKYFDNIVKSSGNTGTTSTGVAVVPTQQSPQREWQSQQTRMSAVVDSRKYSNELYGGHGNFGVNVLLIMYDDLRPELTIYGRNHMITPNFERLAKRSVVFDYCFTQVAVCNPSRNVMLTGLRPDTKRTYSFDAAPDPHLVIPAALKRIGYETAQAGKLFHWDSPNGEIWDTFWDWDWYGYQNKEWDWMRSTVMPDKTKPEDSYPDYLIASETIKNLRRFHERGNTGNPADQQKFMVAAGFKMPHTALHVPFRYFDMYRNISTDGVTWKLTDDERTYPITSPSHSFRCCTDPQFRFMNNEGADASQKSENLGDITHTISQEMYIENMWGYSAAISYIDAQLGRVLDVLDELDLWKNLTVILTADHGMHNGEKGIWEKWTLFDESTRVPLIIHHPQSPFKGMHYTKPVEHVDIFPTIHDLIGAPVHRVKKQIWKPGSVNIPLSGRSLAPVILGTGVNTAGTKTLSKRERGHNNNAHKLVGGDDTLLSSSTSSSSDNVMPTLNKTMAISQLLRCIQISSLVSPDDARYPYSFLGNPGGSYGGILQNQVVPRINNLFGECDTGNTTRTDQLAFMGYSMRTSRFRYTCWLLANRETWTPRWDLAMNPEVGPYVEELYDHRNEKLSDFTHLETVNLAHSSTYRDTLLRLRKTLFTFLKTEVIYSPPGSW